MLQRTWTSPLLAGLLASSLAAAEPVSFNRDVRPILADACFRCHGMDAAQRQAGLRLDIRDDALKGGDSGTAALVAGDAAASELVRRITSGDDAERMPPPDSGKSLTPAQIETLQRWVDEGAAYEGHWAFSPVVRPHVPDVDASLGHVQNSIDNFILARLAAEGMSPSAEADRATLIRRVSLDLTGLPPTPAEVDAFLADDSPDAYERVVDRLLASPHYGERMALEWLDFARYADSNGFQVDSSRYMWPWRDWVIAAFNDNMPFDQFTIEQIAGDLLPNATLSQRIATGFNRNHKLNGEGGIIAEEWRVETVIDRVETTGLTWLALTVGCCRCHDHKFDPVSQREFYQLFAFFNNVTESGILQGETRNTEPVLPVPSAEQEAEIARLEAAAATADQQAAALSAEIPQLLTTWEAQFREELARADSVWQKLELSSVTSRGGATMTRQEDGTWLAEGTNPPNDSYEAVAPIPPDSISGLLLDCLPDARLPSQSLGRHPNGNFILSRFEAEISAPSLPAPAKLNFTRAEADYSQAGWEVTYVNKGNPANGWAIDGPTKKEPRRALFVADAPITVPENATLTVRLFHDSVYPEANVGRFGLSYTSVPAGAVTLDGIKVPDVIAAALAVEGAVRTPEQIAELTKFFRANVDSPVKRADDAAAAARKQLDELRATIPNVMVMQEGAQRESFILIRGEYDHRGETVSAAVPAVFEPLPPDEPANRLALAKWIVSPNNPLTARVWVNRAWTRLFGAGLVRTTENFGTQGEYPSHPELLDWLAAEFMQPTAAADTSRAWDMKSLQKLIVMSATYRQSSHVSPEGLARDPENRLLARGPRFRLQGELVRDQALAVAGLLSPKVGGPSVRPYMPAGVWDETSRYGDLRNYMPDQGEGAHRRTMYTVWKRTAAPPTMLLFDAPNREVCTVKRSRTNTPLQALSLLNEVTFVEAAHGLALRMLQEGGTEPDARLVHGFRLAITRGPTLDELALLRSGFEEDLARFRADPAAATALLQIGKFEAPAGADPAELAAYTLAANVLLNLDEFVTRE